MGLIARHPRPTELENVSIEEIARRYVARFGERKLTGMPSPMPRLRVIAAPNTASSATPAESPTTTSSQHAPSP
jgi:hypothetical protein